MNLTAKPTEESWAVSGEGLGKITADSFPAEIALEKEFPVHRLSIMALAALIAYHGNGTKGKLTINTTRPTK